LVVRWAPTSDLSMELSVARLRSRIDELDLAPEAVQPPDLQVGNDLPFAPRWAGHAGVAYTIGAGSVDVTPRVDVAYQGRTFFDATNTPQIAQMGGYTLYNGSITIQPRKGLWRVVLGVNNAGDKVYRVAGNSSLSTGSGYAETAYARPREYFGTLSYSF